MILYLLLFVLLLYLISGHDVPACGSRVSYYIVVHAYCHFSLLFVLSVIPVLLWYGDEDGVAYTDIYMYYWWKGLARSSAMAYLYVFVGCFIFRRLVPILGRGGWLSVK